MLQHSLQSDGRLSFDNKCRPLFGKLLAHLIILLLLYFAPISSKCSKPERNKGKLGVRVSTQIDAKVILPDALTMAKDRYRG
jgi:hypothetical protein